MSEEFANIFFVFLKIYVALLLSLGGIVTIGGICLFIREFCKWIFRDRRNNQK